MSAALELPAFTDSSVTHQYSTFSQVADEAGESRLYGGIHFRFSKNTGHQLGREMGWYVSGQVMQPF